MKLYGILPFFQLLKTRRHASVVLLIGLIATTISLFSCSKDTDYKVVNFTKRVDVAQPVEKPGSEKALRVAVAAMISPKETTIYYRELLDYLGSKLGYTVELIQRKTYGEINEMLGKGHIDLAFICTGPYISGSEEYGFQAIATPIVRNKPFYQSYLIVHNDSSFQNLKDLKGKIFAFTDPESNTGALVPHYWLSKMNLTPDNFFKNVTYTYSHDNSIMAVAKNLVDGAAIDGHIWEYYQRRNPFYTSKTRVIRKSTAFGSPPLVVSGNVKPELKTDLTRIVLSMHEDIVGLRILNELMIDRFTIPKDDWYASVRHIFATFKTLQRSNVTPPKS